MKTFAVLAVLTALLAVASAQHGARALRQQMGVQAQGQAMPQGLEGWASWLENNLPKDPKEPKPEKPEPMKPNKTEIVKPEIEFGKPNKTEEFPFPPQKCEGFGKCAECPLCPDCTCDRVGLGLVRCGVECVDPRSSDECCGVYNGTIVKCTDGKVCKDGECQCPDNLTECEGKCVDLNSPETCGTDCNNTTKCGDDQTCSKGTCEDKCPPAGCPEGTIECGNECVDPNTSSKCCGNSTTSCGNGEVCQEGNCVCPADKPDACEGGCTDTDTDKNNCGACDSKCPPGFDCIDGECGCPSGTVLCQLTGGLSACVPGSSTDVCPTCEEPSCPVGEIPGPSNPRACQAEDSELCVVCGGNTPSCRDGVCSACIGNGNAEPNCQSNQDCCSCDCRTPAGGGSDQRCNGPPNVGGGANCPVPTLAARG